MILLSCQWVWANNKLTFIYGEVFTRRGWGCMVKRYGLAGFIALLSEAVNHLHPDVNKYRDE